MKAKSAHAIYLKKSIVLFLLMMLLILTVFFNKVNAMDAVQSVGPQDTSLLLQAENSKTHRQETLDVGQTAWHRIEHGKKLV
jgi:hypothetical protein